MRDLKAVVFVLAGAVSVRAHVRAGTTALRATRHRAIRQPDAAFRVLDADDNGNISWEEFRAASAGTVSDSSADGAAEESSADPSAGQSVLAEEEDAAEPWMPGPEETHTTRLSLDDSEAPAELDEPEASSESADRAAEESPDDPGAEQSELAEQEDAARPWMPRPQETLSLDDDASEETDELEASSKSGDREGMNIEDSDELEPDQELNTQLGDEMDNVDADKLNALEPGESDVVGASAKEPATNAAERGNWLGANENGADNDNMAEHATEQTRWETEVQGAEAVVREEQQQERAEEQRAKEVQQQQALSGCKWCAQKDPNCNQLWCSNNCDQQCGASKTKTGAMLGAAAKEPRAEPHWSGDTEPQLSGCAWCSANDAACQQPWCSKNCPEQCMASKQGLDGPGSVDHAEASPQLSGCQWCLANDAKCATKWCANNCGEQCLAPRKPEPPTGATPETSRLQAARMSPEARQVAAPMAQANDEAVSVPLPRKPEPPTGATPETSRVQPAGMSPESRQVAAPAAQPNNEAVSGPLPWMSSHAPLPPTSSEKLKLNLVQRLTVLPATPRETI